MQWKEVAYTDYARADYLGLRRVRRFGNCVVFSGRDGAGRLVLLLEEPGKCVTVCIYDRPAEWEEDILYLQALPPSGAGGVPVRPLFPPPPRWAPDAKPLPEDDSLAT